MKCRLSVRGLGLIGLVSIAFLAAPSVRAAEPSAPAGDAAGAEAGPPSASPSMARAAQGNQAAAPAPSAAALPKTAQPQRKVDIVYLGKKYPEPIPLSLIDPVLTDKGVQGARLGIKDNNVTGGFLGVETELDEYIVPADGDVVAEAKKILAGADRLIVADLEPTDLLAVADLPEAKGSILFNIRSSDDRLRQENCRANIIHIVPNWAMRADALAQYLIWKRWPRWFVVKGTTPEDADYVEAVKRAATRYGGKVVEERTYKFEAGARRVEGGHQQIQTQMPMFTQGAEDHDVVWVVDTGEAFGDYLLYRTFDADPVVGTQGLVPTAWSRAFEQWGGLTLQDSFQKLAHRDMTERDYTGWLAVRAAGEAATRSKDTSTPGLRDYLLSDKFKVAGFKGQQMTVRAWDHQLRQPILLMSPRSLVSVSPQDGFLHEKFPVDTLGFDEPETKCHFPSNDARK
jgi:ABC transporter substrate binding protein (PQQ-dependent alcohol dehydrogenase system)